MDQKPVDTTLYTLSDSVPEPIDARSDERHLTLFRVGSLIVGGSRELCLIKNVSATGMMIRAYTTLREGMPVSVELKQGQMVAGTVRWVRGQSVGIMFDQRVDVVELLSSSMEGPRPRMPRVEVNCITSVRQGANVFGLMAHDVSQGGAKVECTKGLELGGEVMITLPGLPTIPGVVRWQEGNYYGISFNRLLALSELVEWLQDQRSAFAAAT